MKNRLFILFMLLMLILSFLLNVFTRSVFSPVLDHSYPSNFVWMNVFILFVSFFFIGLNRSGTNFIYILSVILAYGFFLTGVTVVEGVSYNNQTYYMVTHLSLTIALLLLWIFNDQLKQILNENERLHRKIEELERYEKGTNILSFSEFVVRSSLLSKSMDRRNEIGFLLKISFSSPSKRTHHSLKMKLLDVCEESVRADFDLITIADDKAIVLFIQNTQLEGMDIIMNRINEKLRPQLNLIELPISFHYAQVKNVEQAMKDLAIGKIK